MDEVYRLNTGKTYTSVEFAALQATFTRPGRRDDSPPVFVDELFVDAVVNDIFVNNLAFRRLGHHKGLWMWWNGRTWEQYDTTGLVRDIVLLLRSFNKMDRYIQDVLWTIANRVAIPHDLFDAVPMLATASGVFHIVDRKLVKRDYIKEDYCTNYLPHAIGKLGDEGRRAWFGILDKVLLDKTDQKCLQQFFGACLFTCYYPQAIYHLHGPGGSGKSTVLTVLEEILGRQRVSHTPLSLIELDSHGISGDIVNSWLNIDTEAEMVHRVAEKYLKAISGNDPVCVNDKYLPKYSKRLNAKLVIVSNDMPRFSDKTNALWSRLVVIPFLQQQSGERDIKDIIDDLRPHFSGIVGWAFLGVADLLRNIGLRNKQFAQSATARALLEQNKETSNPFLLWAREALVETKERWPKMEVYKEYRDWCHRCGYQPLADNSFSMVLRREFPAIQEVRAGGHASSERVRYWVGLGLRRPGSEANQEEAQL